MFNENEQNNFNENRNPQNTDTARQGNGTDQGQDARQGWQNEGYGRQDSVQQGWQNEARDRQSNAQQGWQNESATQQGGWQNESYQQQTDNRGYSQHNAQGGQNYYSDRYRGNSQNGYYNNSWQNESRMNQAAGKAPKKANKGGKIAAAILLAAVFVTACVGISWLAVDSFREQISASNGAITEILPAEEYAEDDKEAAKDQVAESETIQETVQITAVVTDVTDVVEKVMPSCVSITSMSTQEFMSIWGQTYSQDSESSGSGIIIGQNDTELLIVTNNHVVEKADSLYVQFIDGESVQALVKGTDSSVDLAVLAVSLADVKEETKEEICIAKMGDSENLKIGEPAIAIGNALGYGQSVTTGVISALNRTLEVSETGSSNALIQTDAAINPGNSGGALLNINGEVVGINSSKIGDSLVEGMGYAIPISTAKPIIENLMSKETKTKVAEEDRGYLGISCINVTSDISAQFNMPEGVFVAQVYKGTGADKAGLVRGDIITAFDGTTVKNQAELSALTQYYKVGETVEITIMQGSPKGYQAVKVELTLSGSEEMENAEVVEE